MRRRRSSLKKEKAIMLVSSALVLTALTATGLYVRSTREKEENGTIVDFTALEDGDEDLEDLADVGELDYDPSFTEVGSGRVDNPGLNMLGSMADQNLEQEAEQAGAAESADKAALADGTSPEGEEQAAAGASEGEEQASADGEELAMADTAAPEDGEKAAAPSSEEKSETAELEGKEDEDAMSTLPPLDFTEGDVLVWPIVGNVLVNYSMDKTVYFATLQQYKYSPAIVIAAVQGEGITAAADGQVSRIYSDPEIGTAVVMDLGDGYELTYGQLTDLTVSEGDYVNCGEVIGKVAQPTKYYSVEGSNVYFKLTKDGQPVNPLNRLT